MVFTCIALCCGGFHWGEAREGVPCRAALSLSSRSWSPHVGERVGEAGNPGPRGGRHCKELKIVTLTLGPASRVMSTHRRSRTSSFWDRNTGNEVINGPLRADMRERVDGMFLVRTLPLPRIPPRRLLCARRQVHASPCPPRSAFTSRMASRHGIGHLTAVQVVLPPLGSTSWEACTWSACICSRRKDGRRET